MGWKQSPGRDDMVEIVFEFDSVREFHHLHVYANNQFTRDVAVFREARVHFSVGGEVYGGEPVFHLPMEDAIFEDPRNVSVKLHRRVARFVKLQLFFAAKWIMISEVSFDSGVARGNYSDEEEEEEVVLPAGGETERKEAVVPAAAEEEMEGGVKRHQVKEGDDDGGDGLGEEEAALMPVVIGVLTAVILLLAAVIFFIVSRTRRRQRHKWLSVQMNETGSGNSDDAVANAAVVVHSEKEAVLHTEGGGFAFRFAAATSDTNSSGHSSQQQKQQQQHMPKLDDNYNTPHHSHLMGGGGGGGGTLRSMRHLYSRNGSLQSSGDTPIGARKNLPPVPRLQVPPPPPLMPPETPPPPPGVAAEAVYTEPGTYTEPYQAMRYSPYYGYGPVLSEIEDTLMKQSLLSGN